MPRKTNYKKRKKKVNTKRKYSKIKHKKRKYRRKTKNKSLSRKKKNVKGGGVDIDKLTKLSNKYIKSLFHHYNEREEWVDLDDKQRSDVLEQYMEDIEREKKQLKRFFGYGMVQGDESKRYLAKIDTLFEGYKKENPVPEEAVISDIILSKEEVHELFKSLEAAAAGGSLKKNEVKKTQKLKRKKYKKINRSTKKYKKIHRSAKKKSIRRKGSKKTYQRKKKQKGGTTAPHIMFRFLSEEDRLALESFPNEYPDEILTFPLPIDLSPLLLDHPKIKEENKKNRDIVKSRKDLIMNLKRQLLAELNQKNIDKYLEDVKFNLNVTIKKAFYPIGNQGLTLLDEVTINKYLTSHSWVGVRTTHGIHGFFTYNINRKFRSDFYDKYGYWDGVDIRDTGGSNVDAKDLFITTFISDEQDDGNLSNGGNFDYLFSKLRSDETINVDFIDCGEGGVSAAGVNAMADKNMQHIDLGEESVCDGFNGLPEGDAIKYARLGRLMPKSRPQEINLRGKGKISGYHIKMNDYSISYESNDPSKNAIYDDIFQKIREKIEDDKRINMSFHKDFMGYIHSMVVGHFEKSIPVEDINMGETPPLERSSSSIREEERSQKRYKKQNGGYFEMDRQKVQKWENIHSKEMDCCPCVFNLLGLDRDESLELIDTFGNTGMKNDELTDFLKSKYPGYSFSLKQTGKNLNDKMQKIIQLTDLQVSIEDKKNIYSKYRVDYSEEVKDFLKAIPENHGVIGITRSATGVNHCIVFAKMNGRLVYYDAQGMISIIGKEKIGIYLIEKKIYQIGYVMGTETAQYDIAGPWTDIYFDREWGSVKPGLKTKKRTKYSPSIFTDITTDGQ